MAHIQTRLSNRRQTEMKSFVIILFVASIFSHCRAGTISENNFEENAGIFMKLILDNIMTTYSIGCKPTVKGLEAEYNKSMHCLSASMSSGSFCNSLINHFEDCTKTLVETIELCAEPRMYGIATATTNSLVAQSTFMCNTDGEHLMELINPCVLNTFLFNKGTKAENCMSNLFQEIERIKMNNNVKLIAQICKALSNTKDCIKPPFQVNCPNKITQNTVEEIYNSNTKVCGILKDRLE